jgi:hypothetical protein
MTLCVHLYPYLYEVKLLLNEIDSLWMISTYFSMRSSIPIHPNRDREIGDSLMYNQNPNKTPTHYSPYLHTNEFLLDK